MKTNATAVADVDQGIILARVDIAVPPERVFRALTSEEVTAWWGSDETYRTTSFTIDLRPGGLWRAEGEGVDGSAFHVGGEILEVEPPHRLIETWQPSWDDGPPTTLAYLLEAIPEGTRVTVRHTGFRGRAESCKSHGEGWQYVLAWLGGHCAPAVDERFYMVRLIAPRPTFSQDMTPEEAAMMQEHVKYWRGKLAEGAVLAFGPVVAPEGAWGLGLVKASDDAELKRFQADDPAVQSGGGFRYEALPIARLVY